MPDTPKLTTNEKLGLSLFVFICVTALVIQFFRMPKNLLRPFGQTGEGNFQSVAEQEAAQVAALQAADTDHDGLSDYDEIYIFHTSAFNADSDSDGIPDGDEVRNGTDPNCPSGKECRIATEVVATNTATNTATNAAAEGSQPGLSQREIDLLNIIMSVFGDPSQLTPETVKTRVDSMSSQDLRDFLLKLGIPQQALDKSDDTTLRLLVTETITEMITEQNPTSTNSGAAAAGTNSPGAPGASAGTNTR